MANQLTELKLTYWKNTALLKIENLLIKSNKKQNLGNLHFALRTSFDLFQIIDHNTYKV